MSKPDKVGYLAAFGGPAMWGVLPLLYHVLAAFPALEVVVQRTLWCAVLLLIYFGIRGKLLNLRGYFSLSKQNLLILLGAAMIFVNWLIFVYAVMINQVVEASFGYFIYPLVAVAAGVIILQEKLDRRAQIALALSLLGAVVKGISLGGLPLISMGLALSFALYALIRKHVNIDALTGLCVETIWILPFAALYLVFNYLDGIPLFLGGGLQGLWLSIFCGLITIIPLALFLRGNKTLPLSLTGFIFYINPTLQLTVGVVILGEAFSSIDLLAFGCIWLGLLVQFARRQPPATA